MNKPAKSFFHVVAFLVALGTVSWLVTSSNLSPFASKSSAKGDYEAPSGTTYPYPNTPIVVRSRMYTWEMDGMDWDSMTPEFRLKATRDKVWEEAASFVDLSVGSTELVDLWLPSVHDPHDLLSASEEREILTTIARHAKARSEPTPATYRALVEADPNLKWSDAITGLDQLQFRIFYDFFLEKPVDFTRDPQQILDEVWAGLREHKHLYREVGYGTQGAIFPVRRIRAEELVWTKGLRGPDAPANTEYWYTIGARAPMKLVDPIRTIEGVLNTHDSVIVFFALIITRLEDGRLGIWDPVFFVDPESGLWTMDSAGSWSVNTFMTIM